MSLPQVPDAVPRADVLAFCTEIGLDIRRLQGLEIGLKGMYATFHATSGDGSPMSDGYEVATHRLFIPFGEEASGDHRPS